MSTDKKTTAFESIVVDRQSILRFPMPPGLQSLGLDEFRRKLDEAFNVLRQTADLPPLDRESIFSEAGATKPVREGGADD